jgi:hypothetical protein
MMAPFMRAHRIASAVLLAGGVLLVFVGLNRALGVSVAGVVASSAAIVALLYAGGVWFGEPPRVDPSFLLFTRELTVACGPAEGRRVSSLFPETLHRDIEARCREALDGHPCRFSAGSGAARQTIEAAPVRSEEGLILYGILLSGRLVTTAAPERLTPVA